MCAAGALVGMGRLAARNMLCVAQPNGTGVRASDGCIELCCHLFDPAACDGGHLSPTLSPTVTPNTLRCLQVQQAVLGVPCESASPAWDPTRISGFVGVRCGPTAPAKPSPACRLAQSSSFCWPTNQPILIPWLSFDPLPPFPQTVQRRLQSVRPGGPPAPAGAVPQHV